MPKNFLSPSDSYNRYPPLNGRRIPIGPLTFHVLRDFTLQLLLLYFTKSEVTIEFSHMIQAVTQYEQTGHRRKNQKNQTVISKTTSLNKETVLGFYT